VIPEGLHNLSRSELVKLHSQVHSVWKVLSVGQVSESKQAQIWGWHRLIERELENRDIMHPPDWDELDYPLGKILTSEMAASGNEMGSWLFLENFVPLIPKEIIAIPEAVLIDSEKKLMWLSDEGGRQLIKVMYFRILRQFPRNEWSGFRTVSAEALDSIDIVYSLVLSKMSPMWNVQLSLQFEDLCLVKPFLYLVGGLVTRGSTKNDIDVFLRGGLSPELEDRIFGKFVEAIPSDLRDRISRVDDNGLGPYTSYVGAMSLCLTKTSEVNE
jgi:hypothetical protein